MAFLVGKSGDDLLEWASHCLVQWPKGLDDIFLGSPVQVVASLLWSWQLKHDKHDTADYDDMFIMFFRHNEVLLIWLCCFAPWQQGWPKLRWSKSSRPLCRRSMVSFGKPFWWPSILMGNNWKSCYVPTDILGYLNVAMIGAVAKQPLVVHGLQSHWGWLFLQTAVREGNHYQWTSRTTPQLSRTVVRNGSFLDIY